MRDPALTRRRFLRQALATGALSSTGGLTALVLFVAGCGPVVVPMFTPDSGGAGIDAGPATPMPSADEACHTADVAPCLGDALLGEEAEGPRTVVVNVIVPASIDASFRVWWSDAPSLFADITADQFGGRTFELVRVFGDRASYDLFNAHLVIERDGVVVVDESTAPSGLCATTIDACMNPSTWNRVEIRRRLDLGDPALGESDVFQTSFTCARGGFKEVEDGTTEFPYRSIVFPVHDPFDSPLFFFQDGAPLVPSAVTIPEQGYRRRYAIELVINRGVTWGDFESPLTVQAGTCVSNAFVVDGSFCESFATGLNLMRVFWGGMLIDLASSEGTDAPTLELGYAAHSVQCAFSDGTTRNVIF